MDDYLRVECENCREALSARLDSENPGIAPGRIDEHLAGCAGCRNWLQQAVGVTRAVRLQRVDDVPDLTAAILAETAAPFRDGTRIRRTSTTRALRVGLFAVAAGQWAAALGVIFARGVAALPVHGAHELGAFNLALAVGFAWIAWRPGRASAYLPLLGALVGVMAALTAADLAVGHAAPQTEAPHLLLVAGLILTAILARRGAAPGNPPAGVSEETAPQGDAPARARLPHPRTARSGPTRASGGKAA